jgi:hypothetical protein
MKLSSGNCDRHETNDKMAIIITPYSLLLSGGVGLMFPLGVMRPASAGRQ